MTVLARAERDPVLREVVWKRLISFCDEMAVVLVSAAYSTMIRDTRDYATGIVDTEGQTLVINMNGLPAHFSELGEVVKDGLKAYAREGFARGDAIMVNHTSVTGQHINNVNIYTPILSSGELVGFAATYAHWSDVGGITTNRPTTGTTDCYQEGLQVQSVKVYRQGEPVDDVIRLISGNLRRPEVPLADMRAQVAACRVGEARYEELINEFGVDTVRQMVRWVWEEADVRARKAVSAIPDGNYFAESFLDDDASGANREVPIKVAITIDHDEMTMDFAEMAEQANGPINSRSNGPANVAFKSLTSPDHPLTLGDFGALKISVPEGKLIRARPGAPMGTWSWPFATILDTILKALEPALPGQIAAGNCGAFYGAAFLFGNDPTSGRPFISSSIIPLGWGARPCGDGATAHGLMSVQIQDTPVEVAEALAPLEIVAYELRCDSGGAGNYRGGLGVQLAVRCLTDMMACFELDRTKCKPWGLHGGLPGTPGFHKLVLPDGTVTTPPLRGVNYPILRDSVLYIGTGGGGGYGDPTSRPLSAVLDDVIDGYVSVESARKDYKVDVVEDGDTYAVDMSATRRLRAS